MFWSDSCCPPWQQARLISVEQLPTEAVEPFLGSEGAAVFARDPGVAGQRAHKRVSPIQAFRTFEAMADFAWATRVPGQRTHQRVSPRHLRTLAIGEQTVPTRPAPGWDGRA